MGRRLLPGLVLLLGCGSHGAGLPDASDASGAAGPDAASPIVADSQPPTIDAPNFRTSLGGCWTDATCPRVMALAHGGAWDVSTTPYDSDAAIMAAYADGDDGVKIDVRITMDHVAVIAHSSPIEIYESVDCSGKKIEEMTAAQVMACHRFPSSTQTFQRLDDVLGYLRGRMVVQLCVKLTSDFGATIALVHALGAEDFAFIEINAGDVAAVVPGLPGSDSVYYLVNLASDLAPLDALLARHDPRLFMYEIDPGTAIGTLVADKLHPAGVRAFTYDNAASPSVSQLVAHYDAGYDTVSSQSGPNGVAARTMINTARGVSPP